MVEEEEREGYMQLFAGCMMSDSMMGFQWIDKLTRANVICW